LSAAVSRRAHSLTLRAILLLAQVLRASNVALRLVAVDLALCALGLLAVDLALWSLAHWVAHCRAHWVIALPSALRVAVTLDFCDRSHEVSLSRDEHTRSEESKEDEEEGSTHF